MDFVSCLCVSRPQRYGQLQRSILDFLGQTYKDRELVIVVDAQSDYASAVQSFVDQQLIPEDGPQVIVLPRTAKSQLEGLTYGAVHARGNILCLWDDDNLNHPDRLKEQVAVQQRFKTACTVLTEGLYYFHEDAELFVVNMDKPDGTVAQRTLPSTLMAYRQFFPVLEPNTRGRPSEQLVNNTARAGRKVVPIPGKPFLHLVGVTFDNLRTYDYHRGVAQNQSRPVAWLSKVKDELTAALDLFKWDKSVSVEGADGGSFEYGPSSNLWPDSLYPVKVKADPEAAPPPRPTPAPARKQTTPAAVAQGAGKTAG